MLLGDKEKNSDNRLKQGCGCFLGRVWGLVTLFSQSTPCKSPGALKLCVCLYK